MPSCGSPAHPVLDQIELIDLSLRIRILAQTVQPVTVRSLDAIHLGTALHIPSADAARGHGPGTRYPKGAGGSNGATQTARAGKVSRIGPALTRKHPEPDVLRRIAHLARPLETLRPSRHGLG
jgi:hypothetical protein